MRFLQKSLEPRPPDRRQAVGQARAQPALPRREHAPLGVGQSVRQRRRQFVERLLERGETFVERGGGAAQRRAALIAGLGRRASRIAQERLLRGRIGREPVRGQKDLRFAPREPVSGGGGGEADLQAFGKRA